MPNLKQVLPQEFFRPGHRETPVHEFLDAQIVAMKLTTGRPCESHAELFADWPGPQQHVRQWFILDNGKAVGVNEDPVNGLSFPIVDYER